MFDSAIVSTLASTLNFDVFVIFSVSVATFGRPLCLQEIFLLTSEQIIQL